MSRLIWLAGAIIGLSGNAWAGNPGWTEAASVAALEASQQGSFTLRLNLDKNPSGCRSDDGFYADYGWDGSELMYKTLLDAMRSERKVQVYVTGGCNLNGYAAISSVRILP